MKTLVLVALLATAGCSKKTSSSDCDAPINKGMDSFAATIKSRGSGSPMQSAMLEVVEKLRTTFTQRCRDDKWTPEAVACFGAISSQRDAKACESKLTDPQRTKLTNQVREIMMSSMRMPAGIPGHPQMLQGSDGKPASVAPSGAPPAGAVPSAPAPSGAAPAAPAGSAAGSGAAPAAGGSGGW